MASRRSLIPPASQRPELFRPLSGPLYDPAADAGRGMGAGPAGTHPGLPIFLSTQVSLRSGSVDSPNVQPLKAPDDMAMEIHGIHFLVRNTPTASSFWSVDVTGATVGVRFDLGAVKVTNGFIPLPLLSKYQENQFSAQTGWHSFFGYQWALPKPFYIPAGSVLAPTFQHRGFTTQDLTVLVGYSARVYPASYSPRKAYVPYAAAYSTTELDLETAYTGNSNESDLVNATGRPLHLQKLVSNTLQRKTSATTGAAQSILDNQDNELFWLKMIDTGGRPYIRDWAFAPDVLGKGTWDLSGTIMPPSNYLKLFWKKDASGAVAATHSVLFGVGLTGFYEVERNG